MCAPSFGQLWIQLATLSLELFFLKNIFNCYTLVIDLKWSIAYAFGRYFMHDFWRPSRKSLATHLRHTDTNTDIIWAARNEITNPFLRGGFHLLIDQSEINALQYRLIQCLDVIWPHTHTHKHSHLNSHIFPHWNEGLIIFGWK